MRLVVRAWGRMLDVEFNRTPAPEVEDESADEPTVVAGDTEYARPASTGMGFVLPSTRWDYVDD